MGIGIYPAVVRRIVWVMFWFDWQFNASSSYLYFVLIFVLVIVAYFSGRVHLPFTWSHGMRTFSSSLTFGRTPDLKNIVLGISSWVFGSRICSWDASRITRTGRWCVRTNVRDSFKFGAISSRHFMSGEWIVLCVVNWRILRNIIWTLAVNGSSHLVGKARMQA